MSDDDEECDAVPRDRRKLVRRVPNPLVVRDRYAAAFSDVPQPLLVRAIGCETVVVPFNRESGSGQNFGELLAKIAVCEKDETQAARSYSTASSISGRCNP